jgi:alpha-L-rhamnosidase
LKHVAPPPFPVLTAARWIWPGSLSFDIRNDYALFRKIVVLDAPPAKAPTLVTADQSYQLFVNGHYIARGPARGYQQTWSYDEIDLAPWLHAGENLIAVRAHNPGFSTFQYRFEGFAGFLLMGHWGDMQVVTDSTWKSRRQDGMARDTVPSTVQLFPQEHGDARQESDEWMRLVFNDSAWHSPATSSAWNSLPWFSLEPRGTPLLRETHVLPTRVLGVGHGANAEGFTATRNVVSVARNEAPHHLPLTPGESMLMPATLSPEPSPDGHFTSILLDFGRTVVGSLRLRVTGAAGGEIIDALVAETVFHRSEGIVLNLDPTEVSQISLGSRLICRTGTTDHTFYHPYGFRYLMLRIRNAQTRLTLEPSLYHIGYPFEIVGTFHSSDAELNRIWDACSWSQQVCSLDAYVDTPWREQAQWWGDARVQAWNTFHLANDARLLRRGIQCIGRQTTPDGLTYGHAPTMAHHCVLPDFTLIWIVTLWDYYWQTGSTEAFEENLVPLEKALGYFQAHADPDTGLIQSDPRHWLFLDWSSLDTSGQPTLLSLWLLISLDKVTELYGLTGNTTRAAVLVDWAARLRRNLRALIAPDGLLLDGYSASGTPLQTASIHSQTLAISAKLFDAAEADKAINTLLLPFIRETSAPEARPSIYWLTYVFTVLDDHGHGEDVVRYIRKYWARMAEHGTTWSQLKEYGGTQSHSHAWSAHPLYHFMQIVGGVRQTAPAWREIEFRPLFWNQSSHVRVPTPHGLIDTCWKRNADGHHDVQLTLPENITARITLPDLSTSCTAGTHAWPIPSSPSSL